MENGEGFSRDNSGFSLVELIIVIAILAILASAIGANVIRYIERSRQSVCEQTRDTMMKEYETRYIEKLDSDDDDQAANDYTIPDFLDEWGDEEGSTKCKSRGRYIPSADGKSIVCTKHDDEDVVQAAEAALQAGQNQPSNPAAGN